MSLISLLRATEKQVHLGRLHMRPIHWHLKSNWRIPQSLEKVIPIPTSLHPHLQWWLKKQRTHRPAFTPHKACATDLYRATKEGWGAHLNECTARGSWSLPESMLHINYLELKAVFLALKEFQDLCTDQIVLVATDNTTVVSYISKEGGMCPTVENLDLVYQETSNSQSPTHTRPAEHGSRQAIQVRPDHPNRVVSPSRGIRDGMQQVALASDRPICHQFQQQTASICVSDARSLGHSSGCTQSAMGRSGCTFPPVAILGKVVEKLQDTPCKKLILIALEWPNMPWFWDLVSMSSRIPLCLPNLPNLLTQPFNQTPHRNLTNLNLHAWLLEPQQSRSRVSLRQWQQELRLLKDDQLDQSMRQSGPFLRGVSLIRWTSGHPL